MCICASHRAQAPASLPMSLLEPERKRKGCGHDLRAASHRCAAVPWAHRPPQPSPPPLPWTVMAPGHRTQVPLLTEMGWLTSVPSSRGRGWRAAVHHPCSQPASQSVRKQLQAAVPIPHPLSPCPCPLSSTPVPHTQGP